MGEYKYEQYVERGPDGMASYQDVLAALAWRDSNPEEAARVRRAHEARVREQEDKETMRDLYQLEHGSLDGFERAYAAVKSQKQADTLSELQRKRDEDFLRINREF